MVLSSRRRNMSPMARALLFLVFLGFSLDFSHVNSKMCALAAGDASHGHLHCDHGHHHHHNHDDSPDKEKWARSKLLPEELAEEEDMKLYGFGPYIGHVDDHDHAQFVTSDLSTAGLWIRALSCSLLVSMASLICLVLLPIIFVQGKPSKAIVDSLALFGAGAMLGDAFLHQLPHAFGGGHSHGSDKHENHGHDHAGHDHSHGHSMADLSVGISVLAGIILFLLVEKVLRYVEDNSGGGNKWSHGHHHHHHRKSDNVKDDSNNDDRQQSQDKDGEKAVESFEGDMPSEVSTLKGKKVNKRVLRKRNTVASSIDDTQTDNVDGPVADSKILHENPPPESTNLLFGYLNLVSDGVHNFTDGMALGSAFLLYGSVGGWSRTLFLLVHELPQEVGDFGILVRSGFSVSKALFFNFLSALVALAGTALALLLGKDPGQSSLIEGFTAGGFIYIAVAGVLAEMNNSGKTTFRSIAVQLTSLLAGMAIALSISLLE